MRHSAGSGPLLRYYRQLLRYTGDAVCTCLPSMTSVKSTAQLQQNVKGFSRRAELTQSAVPCRLAARLLVQVLLLNGSHDRETSTCGCHTGAMRASDVVTGVTDALNRRRSRQVGTALMTVWVWVVPRYAQHSSLLTRTCVHIQTPGAHEASNV